MIPASVDLFLCCGTSYRALRDAVGHVLLENQSDTFIKQMQVRETEEQKERLMTVFNFYGGKAENKRKINQLMTLCNVVFLI